ncbi:manganese superoxide dismutase [Rhodotorula toruloides]|uniref:Manganese superoxide dismutase n=1 Tax=Rhodotorula toruloides TaxID=5286 RepID=A0A511KHA0_RHOTO|nr:manganese superoxide dismutase [Rhodotorula toruloides]
MASIRTLPSSARQLARSRSPAVLNFLPSQRRLVHHRVPLAFDVDEGLKPFLSADNLRTVAVDWQDGVLARLNELIRGTEYENLSVLQTLKQSATNPSHALIFNYASEALNNSFFLSNLSPNPTQPTLNSNFSQQIASTASLGSFAALVSHFSAHVSGLHPSSGAYVWLVTDPHGNLGVVGTYAGGTVLVRERAQMGPGGYASKDLKVLGEKVEVKEGEAAPAPAGEVASAAGAGGAAAGAAWQTIQPGSQQQQQQRGASQTPVGDSLLKDGALDPSKILFGARQHHASSIGQSIHPLVCISTHPHCYFEDYGIWGRDEYVQNWWAAVDWQKVERAYDQFRIKQQSAL